MRLATQSTAHTGLVGLWLLAGACSGSSAPPIDEALDEEDAGSDSLDQAGPTLSWPTELVRIDAAQPALAIGAGGPLVLSFVADGQVFVSIDPGSGLAPVAVGDQVAESSWLRAIGAPDADRILVVWSYTRSVWVDSSGPQLPADRLIDSFDHGSRLALGWTGSRPLLVIEDTDGTRALGVAPTGATRAPAPVVADLLLEPRSGALYHNEIPRAVDLGSDRILVFDSDGEANAAGAGHGTEARWVIGQRDPAVSPYVRPQATGSISLPGAEDKNRFWIHAHDLGEGGHALSWAEIAPGSMVFDLFLARLHLDAHGTPSSVSGARNLSNTPGQTDNSDHLLLLPTADSRVWAAWRERNFGPRVALLDKDLLPLALTAPDDELRLDDSQPISAVVDASGGLFLAAVVRPAGTAEVRCWHFPLPD